jgi:hypothetical protein
MKRQIGILMAAWLTMSAFPASSRADTSYLLIQGDFGSGGVEENFKWQVNYPTGDLSTGQDLLNAVFGQPVLIGTYTDGFFGTYNEYQAGSGSQAVNYIEFGDSPDFPISFTLNGTTLLQDPSYSPGWIYYVAGGAGGNGADDDGDGASYPDGTWSFSNDGIASRTISDGSYDGWVFGNTNNPDTIDDSSGTAGPNSTEFPLTSPTSFLTVVTVPEPGAPVLLGAALAALALWKRKARA